MLSIIVLSHYKCRTKQPKCDHLRNGKYSDLFPFIGMLTPDSWLLELPDGEEGKKARKGEEILTLFATRQLTYEEAAVCLKVPQNSWMRNSVRASSKLQVKIFSIKPTISRRSDSGMLLKIG